MELKEGDIVLCTVKKIEKTTVFLDIEGYDEGSMMLSEVSAGRIRNLRQYVSPNKKVVCKILSLEPNNIQLSLRRVTTKEREEVLERHKREKKLINTLKTITDNSKTIIEKIKQSYDLVDFFEEAKENPLTLKEFFTLPEIEKIEKILTEKTEKDKKIKKIFKLTSLSSSGLQDIKEILTLSDSNIKYLGSSKFSITVTASNFKEASKKITESLEIIEKRAKQKHAQINIKEK